MLWCALSRRLCTVPKALLLGLHGMRGLKWFALLLQGKLCYVDIRMAKAESACHPSCYVLASPSVMPEPLAL